MTKSAAQECFNCGRPMQKDQSPYALVRYVGRGARVSAEQVNTKDALPVVVYYCENCGQISLKALE